MFLFIYTIFAQIGYVYFPLLSQSLNAYLVTNCFMIVMCLYFYLLLYFL